MSRLRFLLDENVDPILRKALHRRVPELEVWRVGDPIAPSYGTSDPDILRWCAANRFALLTHNRASMPGHLRSFLHRHGHAPPIFVLHPSMTIEETVQELLLIWGASEAEEYENSIWYLPLS
ncbi:MAG: hypothetical protein D6694_13060 [Gammaproteobacteria bacterium]|nr:MAG: hypothetical protein D6694_13060 [Gammaproteobacteria bacterium]